MINPFNLSSEVFRFSEPEYSACKRDIWFSVSLLDLISKKNIEDYINFWSAMSEMETCLNLFKYCHRLDGPAIFSRQWSNYGAYWVYGKFVGVSSKQLIKYKEEHNL